jgi:peptidoglycan/xylan/chitin deacetylase (PgdA/CDA1 family)
VWLTFDDGPDPQHTAAVLDALKAKRVIATFFVVGSRVEKFGAELLRRARSEGHSIGNHSYSHGRLTTMSENEVECELVLTDRLIAEFTGSDKLFRPPFGAANAKTDRVAERLGYRKLLWEVDTRDWHPDYQSKRWVRHAVDQIRRRESAVVLAHDIHASTAAHVGRFIDELRKLGMSFYAPD